MIALGEVEQVIPDCLSGAGGEASFRDDAERAIEISQTLTVAEGVPFHPSPIGIDLSHSQGYFFLPHTAYTGSDWTLSG